MARKKQPTAAIATVGESTEKKRKGKPPKPSMDSIDDATFIKWAGEALREKTKLDEQSGTYRGVLKKAKAEGVSTKAITDWLKDKNRDPLELASEQKAKARLYRLMNMPQGTQFNMLDEEPVPAETTDRGVMQHRAYEAGMSDGKAAKTFDATRYPNDPDLQKRFEDGWHDGQDAITNLGRKHKPGNGAEASAATH